MDKITYLVAVITITYSRIALKTLEMLEINKYVYAGGFRWHHSYTGATIFVIGLALPKKWKLRPWVLGIGLGLFLDEPNTLLTDLGIADFHYWSPVTLGMVFSLLLLLGIWTYRKNKPYAGPVS